MIREEKFVMSRRPFAVDLSTFRVDEHGFSRVNAVWFRRRRGVTVSCIGTLWGSLIPAPQTVHEFLERHTDGRYGGDTVGRWDGTGYWGVEDPDEMAAHLAVLRPMLDNYPNVPVGYDGWWTFHTPGGSK